VTVTDVAGFSARFYAACLGIGQSRAKVWHRAMLERRRASWNEESRRSRFNAENRNDADGIDVVSWFGA
jgi:hypothetical protein